MAEWTKGPWVAKQREGKWVVDCDIAGEHICEIVQWSPEADEADARLIAAAPELYEALEDAEHFVRGKLANIPKPLRGTGTREEKLHERICAALSRARGTGGQ